MISSMNENFIRLTYCDAHKRPENIIKRVCCLHTDSISISNQLGLHRSPIYSNRLRYFSSTPANSLNVALQQRVPLVTPLK